MNKSIFAASTSSLSTATSKCEDFDHQREPGIPEASADNLLLRLIKICRSDGGAGAYRFKMTDKQLKRSGYGDQWQFESSFSGLKRATGGALSAGKDTALQHEAAFWILAYTPQPLVNEVRLFSFQQSKYMSR